MAKLGVKSSLETLKNSKKPAITIGSRVTRALDTNRIHGYNDPLKGYGTNITLFAKVEFNFFGQKYGSQKSRKDFLATSAGKTEAELQIRNGIRKLVNFLSASYDSFHYLNDETIIVETEEGSELISRIGATSKVLKEIDILFKDPTVSVGVLLSKLESLMSGFGLFGTNNEKIKNILNTEISLLEITGELTEDYMSYFGHKMLIREIPISTKLVD
jgi:hypothetical protein